MRSIIIGGGKVGSYLARELDRAGHSVTVIESDRARAAAVSESTNSEASGKSAHCQIISCRASARVRGKRGQANC